MTRKRWFFFVAAIALQILLLLGMAGRHTYTLRTGQAVRLETEPVDPWSLFRGQYVALNYKISQFKKDQVPMAGAPYRRGQQVWVTLREGNPFWTAVAIATEKPTVGPNEVALLGTVQWWAGEMTPDDIGQLRIHYGIEQFFVPEGQGPVLEDPQRQHQLSIEAVVDRFGRAAIRRAFVDGKEVNFQ